MASSTLSPTQLYDRIRIEAPRFLATIERTRVAAHNEAEFESAANAAIAALAKDLGVQVDPRQEYTLVTGRADAVYNRFVIEYEPPGSLRGDLSHRHTQHAVKQVKDYISGLAHAERHDRDRLLGTAFDGHFVIFVRFQDGRFIVEEPLAVNGPSMERFLRSLFSLSAGRALIPENLVEDFGSQHPMARDVTRALYNALAAHGDGLTGKLYAQWQLFFGEVAGTDAATGHLKHKREMQAFAKGMGLQADDVDAPRLFFALHTYFSFLVKTIARLVLQALAGGGLGTTPLTTVANLEGESLRRELEKVEDGGIFKTLGLKNLLEGDFFAWYLHAWDAPVEEALRRVLARLADYNAATVQDDPYSARDLLKKLYHYLLPREIRHDLGEFYTPDWLAERLLTQLNEPLFVLPGPGAEIPTPNKRVLDPACGSGTFLILAARALKANCQQAGLAEADTLEVILNSVSGIDLNPLAVLAARVNLLLAIADLLPYRRGDVELPVYLADSILTPSRGKDLFTRDRWQLETSVGTLPVPEVINTRPELERLTDLLDEYVRGGFQTDVFLQRCRAALPDVAAHPESEPVLRELFERLVDLHRQGLDGIWARVLKNAFMPMFMEPFDYVVGNLAWINWESLPQGYRDQSTPLWRDYGLFVHSGMDAILGKGKKDISTLMTYVAIDRYLKDGGKLGFVITQSVWKTSGAGQGFRRFRIGQNGAPFRVLHVDDMSALQVFEGASTRTSVFVAVKGEETRYPVTYTYWRKVTRGKSMAFSSTIAEVMDHTNRIGFHAVPVDDNDSTSAWLTARPMALKAISKARGKGDYVAHAGAYTGGANAVYWMELLLRRPDGMVVIRNLTEGAKREAESITTQIEPDLLYPLLRGRDVGRWIAIPSAHILMMQDRDSRRGLSESVVQEQYPKTWSYLQSFEGLLRQRKSQSVRRLMDVGPFYSMFAIGDYTFSDWKVIWREQSSWFTAAVIGPCDNHVVIPDHKLMLVSVESMQEAHYLGALLNSSLVTLMVWAFAIDIQQTTHVLNRIDASRYNAKMPAHRALSDLSLRAHALAPQAYAGNPDAQRELAAVEDEVDRAAAALWGLTDEELEDVRASLRELKG